MARGAIALMLLGSVFVGRSAFAEERDYCPARPGLGTPACTTAPGRVSVEVGLADWSLDSGSDARTDTVLLGDTLVRVGLSDRVEAQIGWTPYGQVRSRERTTGTTDISRGVGDVFLGLGVNLANPDGSGFSVAVIPFVTLPVGGNAIGAGDWGSGVTLPISYDLGKSFSLQLTPQLAAAVDSDRSGRHAAYSVVAGLGFPVASSVSGTIEAMAVRDDDPAGATTQTYASLSFGWTPLKDWQFDVGGVAGLNRNSADAELYFGVSRLF